MSSSAVDFETATNNSDLSNEDQYQHSGKYYTKELKEG